MSLKARILEASVEFISQPFAKVLQLSSGLIDKATEARVTVRVEVGGREGRGRGSIYLGTLWSWPDHTLSHEQREKSLRDLCETIATHLEEWCGTPAHPLEMGLRLHQRVCSEPAPPPTLARALCASPFDAALHDATGQALRRSAFSFYDEAASIPAADFLFPAQGAVAAIRAVLREPAQSLPAWWIVSARDDLAAEMVAAIRTGGYRHFKIKALGHDPAADAARTVEVFRCTRAAGVDAPLLDADPNEAHRDAASVLEYLDRLEALDQDAYAALAYLEQPTSRDILRHAYDWRAVARCKPVFLDEGLSGFDVFPAALEQGWSGFAVKTCKGHSFSLVAAAWARQHGLALAVQDLGNPGYAAIHGFLLAAHLPTINGVELNSPQLSPAANEPWLPRLESLFQPRAGVHTLATRQVYGLGSNL